MGSYSYVMVRGATHPFDGRLADESRALVFWHPDSRRLPQRAADLLGPLEDAGVRFAIEQGRQQVKMQRFGVLLTVIFVADAQAECSRLADVLRDLLQRRGGKAEVFVPAREDSA
jgi:hypothetical protein